MVTDMGFGCGGVWGAMMWHGATGPKGTDRIAHYMIVTLTRLAAAVGLLLALLSANASCSMRGGSLLKALRSPAAFASMLADMF